MGRGTPAVCLGHMWLSGCGGAPSLVIPWRLERTLGSTRHLPTCPSHRETSDFSLSPHRFCWIHVSCLSIGTSFSHVLNEGGGDLDEWDRM